MYVVTILNPEREIETRFEWNETDSFVVIGRDPECDIIVNTPKASRKHCRLEFEDDTVYLVDLDSMNGTFYGGISIDRTDLQETDRFKIEDWSVEIKPEGAPDPSSPKETGETTTGHEPVSPGEEPESGEESVEAEEKEEIEEEEQEKVSKSRPEPEAKEAKAVDKPRGKRKSKKRSPLKTFLLGLLYSAILTVIGAAIGTTATVFLLKNPDFEVLGYDLEYKIEKEKPENPSLEEELPPANIDETVKFYYRQKSNQEIPVSETGYFLKKHRTDILDSLSVYRNYGVGIRNVALVSFTVDDREYHDVIWFRTQNDRPLVSSAPPENSGGSGNNDRTTYFFGPDSQAGGSERRKIDEILRRTRSWLEDGEKPPWR